MQKPINMFDVIICGAGPAGCTAALALGSSGLKVGLIEKERYPREKICGDAIPAYVPKVLNSISPYYARAFERLPIKEVVKICRIVAPNEKVLDLKFSEQGYICKRMIFDNFLFDLASQLSNLTVFQDTSVMDVKIIDNEVMINSAEDLRFKARLVIGCDGAHSIIKRILTHTKVDSRHSSEAVRAYFKNVKDIPGATFELHFLKNVLPGYFWIFPLPDNYSNVGLGMPSNVISAKRINLKREMAKIIDSVPYLKQRFSDSEMVSDINGCLLPLGSRKVTISGNRFMLCGDAASLIDPATGAGIGQAILAGRYAGWHAVKCFEKNDFSNHFMKRYDKTVYDKLWRHNIFRFMIRNIINSQPLVLNAAINMSLKSKFIYKTTLRILE
jgi:geranylgeranyl reductase family protein